MSVSKRLETIVSFVQGRVLADIGCDHAYVVVQSLLENRVQKAYACDVSQGPLERARANIEISGLINRDITIFGDTVKIDSVQIAGNLKITASNINITENSIIMGELSYNDDAIFTKADTASIGEVNLFKRTINSKPTLGEKVLNHLTKIISLLLIFVVLMVLFPKLFINIGNTKKDIVKNMGYGILALITVPIISLLLILTTYGFTLGIIIAILYLIFAYIGIIFTGYLLGHIIWTKYIKIKKTIYLEGILGISILYLLTVIPYIGLAIYFLSIIISYGTIINIILKKRKNN